MALKGSTDANPTWSQSSLERMYIEEYLQSKGYTLSDLHTRDKSEVKRLMTEACTYSSYKLAELESRSKFREKIHFE